MRSTEPDEAGRERRSLVPDELLLETPWMRRLARSLCLDEASAEDLVQSAVCDLLVARPRVEPTSRRAWLRTFLRRRAGRDRRRGHVARRAELLAARSEAQAGSLDEEERLRLHQELVREIAALDREDRRLIVRRYFDEVPPRVLAKELGISPEAARQRVARALGKLRKRLGHSERGAERWALALFVLAQPPANGALESFPTRPAPLKQLTLMSTSSALSTVVLSGASIVLAVSFLRTPEPEELRGSSSPLEDDLGRASLEGQHEGGAQRAALTGSQAEPAVVESEEVGSPSPKVRVVDLAGAPLTARAAWVGMGGELQTLELNPRGVAPRPSAETFRLFVAARGYVAHQSRIETPGEVIVHLRPAPVVEGVLTVDGQAPGRPLTLGVLGLGEVERDGIESWEFGLKEQLNQQHLLPEQPSLVTDASGAFRISMASPHERFRLWLPSGYVAGDGQGLVVSEDRSAATFELGAQRDFATVSLDLLSVPMITGRYVWEDGEPVEGLLTTLRNDPEGYGIDGMRNVRLERDGTFTLGVHERLDQPGATDRAESVQLLPQRLLGERAHVVRAWISTPNFVPGSERSFEVHGDSFPIEVGVIRVPRPARTEVQVLGRTGEEWHPLRAVLRAPTDTATSDREGRATLLAGPGTAIDILAEGFEFTRIVLPRQVEPEPYEIQLEPAPTLALRYPEEWSHLPFEFRPVIQLAYDESPFGPWSDQRSDSPEYHHKHHSHLYGVWRSGLSMLQSDSAQFALDRSGELRIHGLRRGASFELSVEDCFRRPILSHSLTFTGERTLDLAASEPSLAYLRCDVLDSTGQAIPGGRVGLHGEGWSSYREFEGSSFTLGPLAIQPCLVSLNCGGAGRLGKQEWALHPGENHRSVSLLKR